MCSSVLDLALGFLEKDPENYSTTGISADDARKGHEEEIHFDNLDENTNNSPSSISNARRVRTCNLFEILRLRIDDDKPLVRVKAIQAFAAALGLNYPKCTSDGFMTLQGVTVTICDLSGTPHFTLLCTALLFIGNKMTRSMIFSASFAEERLCCVLEALALWVKFTSALTMRAVFLSHFPSRLPPCDYQSHRIRMTCRWSAC